VAVDATTGYLIAILLAGITFSYQIGASVEKGTFRDRLLAITLLCIWLSLIQAMIQGKDIGPENLLLVYSMWLGLAIFLFALCIVPFIISYWLTTRKKSTKSE
jgi:hypothetical protein